MPAACGFGVHAQASCAASSTARRGQSCCDLTRVVSAKRYCPADASAS